MNPSLIEIACPHCAAINRVPQDKLENLPHCGKCHQALFDGHPVTLTDANFDNLTGRTGVPVVVDCWAAWCGPCRMFVPVFEQAAQQLEPRLRFAKLDTEAHTATAAHLGIRSIPTLIAFRMGKEVARMSGAMPLPQFTSWLRQQGLLT